MQVETAAADVAPRPPPPEQVGSYALVRRIGSGGMAEVWLGRHVVSGGVAAVKRLSPEAARRPNVAEFLDREVRMVARLSHPHIVPLFEYGDGYVVMPYIEGTTLSRRMQSPIEPVRAVAIIHQVASALAHAHQRGVIHRDVKPSNILLDHNETAFLADFGIASSSDEGPDRPAGTPRYMAPEQATGDKVGPAADQYGLARTLIEVLGGGRLPTSRARALAQLPDTLPAGLRAVLDRGTAVDPDQRYPSVAAFADALAAVDLSGLGANVRLAEPRRGPDAFPWLAAPEHEEQLADGLVRGDYRVRDLAARGRLDPDRVERYLSSTGLADVGFSIYASTPRLGPLADPLVTARASEVLVLCHGWACSRAVWRLQAPALCRDNALALVLVPDLHGGGATPFAERPTREQASLRGMADAVLGLVGLLGLDGLPSVLVGHSMGAMALLTLDDAELPPQVARLLINPVLVSHDAGLRRTFRLAAWLTNTIGRIGWLRRFLVNYLYRRGSAAQMTRADQDQMIALQLAIPPGVAARIVGAMASAPLKVGRQRRVALISGVDDEFNRDEALLRTAATDLGLDPAHIQRLASGGHSPMMESAQHPEWTARNIDEISRAVQAMILTAHEPTRTPSQTVTSGETATIN